MVIQSNMSSKAIVEVWENTFDTFSKYNIVITDRPLEVIVKGDFLPVLLRELNEVVGSSSVTCIEGG